MEYSKKTSKYLKAARNLKKGKLVEAPAVADVSQNSTGDADLIALRLEALPSCHRCSRSLGGGEFFFLGGLKEGMKESKPRKKHVLTWLWVKKPNKDHSFWEHSSIFFPTYQNPFFRYAIFLTHSP